MFMVCWHYCLSFLSFLWLAVAPILVIGGAFVMKRGVVQYKASLRKRALMIWCVAAAKAAILDTRLILKMLMCDEIGRCHPSLETAQLVSFAMVTAILGAVFVRLYSIYIPDRKTNQPVRTDLSPLKHWTWASIVSVSLFIIWVLTPWVMSLTVGNIPTLFLTLSWHYMAILASVSLFMAFWRLEDFQWYFSSTKSKQDLKKNVWVPKDTLWTLILMHGVTLLLALASSGMIEDAAQTRFAG